MSRLLVVLASLLLFPARTEGDDRVLDWVRVTDRAGGRARDSSGEVVYKDRLWLLGAHALAGYRPLRDPLIGWRGERRGRPVPASRAVAASA